MKLRSRKGSEVVEFALVLPVLLIIVFGILDFGLAIYDKAVITNASREGARAGIVYRYPTPTEAQLETIVRNVVNAYCSTHLVTFSGSHTPTITFPQTPAGSGTPIEVRINYQYNYLAISNFLGLSPLNLTSSTVMRME
jgi:Flp pilus assembly protein TadG